MKTLEDFLAEQEQLAAKATKGPWSSSPYSAPNAFVWDTSNRVVCNPATKDAIFIAAARTSVPLMVKITREWIKEVAQRERGSMSLLIVMDQIAERILNEKEVTR